MLSEHFGSGRQTNMPRSLLVMRLWLCLTVLPVRSTHDHCTRQASGMTSDSYVMEKPSKRVPSNSLLTLFEKVSVRATTWEQLFLHWFTYFSFVLFLWKLSKKTLPHIFLFLSYNEWRWNKVSVRWKTHAFARFEIFRKVNLWTLKFCGKR